MAFPVILYTSLIRTAGAVLAASSTETGFSVNAVMDYKPWLMWKSGTLVTGIIIDIDLGSDIGSADTIGIVNHNITSEGGTIEIRADVSAGANPPTTVRQAAYTPAYGDVDLKTFTLASNLRRWRLVLAKGGNFVNKPYLGEVFIGIRTTLPEYMDPAMDPFDKQTEASIQHSEGGQYLGAVTRGRMHRETLSIGVGAGMARSFYTSDLNAFIDTHYDMYRPFFYQLDSADSDFVRPFYLVKPIEAQHRRQAIGGVWSRLSLTLPAVEAFMEAP